MKRTIELGKVDYLGSGRKACPVTLTIGLEDREEGLVLSICGEVWNHTRTDVYSAGQNYDEILALFPHSEKVKRIVEVWKRWHLNGMRAGCVHQRKGEWNKKPIDPGKPLNVYGKHHPNQTSDSWNMLTWVRPEEVPGGLLGVACPMCGYQYGTAWLFEPLPAEIVEEVKSW